MSPCPWCGESVPVDPRTPGDVLRAGAGLVVLVLAAAGVGADGIARGGSVFRPVLQGLFAGFFLALGPISVGRRPTRATKRGTPAIASGAALAAALAGLSLRAAGVPFPTPFATPLARLLPAVAAALFALRVPAEAPNAPASGSPRVRALRRFAPDWIAAALLLPFAVLPTFSPLGLSLVLGALLHRLSRPGVPLVLAAVAFALLLPEPVTFAFGILAAALLPTAR
jgi:hypothetical protein